jgi:hypothetical protein
MGPCGLSDPVGSAVAVIEFAACSLDTPVVGR